jgi:hypothetical protein
LLAVFSITIGDYKMKSVFFTAVLLLLSATAQSAVVNLISYGDLEAGVLGGLDWRNNGSAPYAFITSETVHSGNYALQDTNLTSSRNPRFDPIATDDILELSLWVHVAYDDASTHEVMYFNLNYDSVFGEPDSTLVAPLVEKNVWTKIDFTPYLESGRILEELSLPNVLSRTTYAFTYDDLVMNANVVPIPAAVWLFGSALAGLGWIRRKQTV